MTNEQRLMRTVAELKNEICRMQVRNEELEQDRNYNAIKATELQMSLEAFKNDEVHDALLTKSMQLAEAMTDVDLLKVKLRKVETEQQLALKEREKLSNVVRTLQHVAKSDDGDDADGGEDDEVVLTAERALEMALKNMKYQIEFLEEERQRLASECASQKKTVDSQTQQIDSLQKENHLASLRVAMLTQLIRDSNEPEKPATNTEDSKKIQQPKPSFEAEGAAETPLEEYTETVKDADENDGAQGQSWVANERRKRVDALRAWKSGKKEGSNRSLGSFIGGDSGGASNTGSSKSVPEDPDSRSPKSRSNSFDAVSVGGSVAGARRARRSRRSQAVDSSDESGSRPRLSRRSMSNPNLAISATDDSNPDQPQEPKPRRSRRSSRSRPGLSRRSMSNPDLCDDGNENDEQPKRRSSRSRPRLSRRSMSNPNLCGDDNENDSQNEQPRRQSRRSARRAAAGGEDGASRPRLSRRSMSNPNLLG